MAPVETSQDFSVIVERRETLAAGVVGITLASVAGDELPAWSPGAHIDLVLDDALIRQYSLCGDPSDRHRMQIAVLRETDGRGGSAYLHDEVVEGQSLIARGPRNNFRLHPSEEYLFIAGGIGVTPFLPMIDAVARRGSAWRLVYGGRSRCSMAFTDWLQQKYPGFVTVLPEDETGLLPLGDLISSGKRGRAIYCCGPEPLLTAIESECVRRGLPEPRLERFAARQPAGDGPDGDFEVVLALTGTTFVVTAGESILDKIEELGVPVDSSCRDGTCGSCETGVVDGTPDHRDSILTPAEQDASETMMVCVSRCKGKRLVLDL